MAQGLVLIPMFKKFNKFFIKRVIVLFILFCVVNIIANISSLNILTDIFSHFKVQYFYVSFFFLFSFIYLTFSNRKFILGAVIALFILVMNLFSIMPFSEKLPEMPTGTTFKVGLFNVYSDNKYVQLLLDEIYNNNPDVLVLQEVNEFWLNSIQSLKTKYPYYKEYPRDDNFGIALYSKTPLKNAEVEFWSDYYVPVVTAEIGAVKIYCVHTLPPVGFDYINVRNKMLQKIGEILGRAPHEYKNILVVGDLNITVFSSAYNLAVPPYNSYPIYDAINYVPKTSGSWNAFYPPFFRVTLEHILSTWKIIPTKVYFGEKIGSDHLPVFAEFRFSL